jgi:hypothetical protein
MAAYTMLSLLHAAYPAPLQVHLFLKHELR